jgi:hypothetical protein
VEEGASHASIAACGLLRLFLIFLLVGGKEKDEEKKELENKQFKFRQNGD